MPPRADEKKVDPFDYVSDLEDIVHFGVVFRKTTMAAAAAAGAPRLSQVVLRELRQYRAIVIESVSQGKSTTINKVNTNKQQQEKTMAAAAAAGAPCPGRVGGSAPSLGEGQNGVGTNGVTASSMFFDRDFVGYSP